MQNVELTEVLSSRMHETNRENLSLPWPHLLLQPEDNQAEAK